MMPKVRERKIGLHSAALGSGLVASAMFIPFDDASAKAKVLYVFTGGADGSQPSGDIARDEAGNLYGTTYYSNSGCEGRGGCGTVFKLAPSGSEAVLYSFQGRSDGAHPLAGVVADASGNVYGTTESGGGGSCDANFGCGTIFKLAPDGTETLLHAFSGADGAYPFAGLIKDDNGNVYGTTFEADKYFGEVFELTPKGKLKVLHGFAGGKDGMYPTAALMADGAGNLYGTTTDGGGFACSDSEYGCGTIFKIGTDGSESIVYAFKGGADGAHPNSPLLADAAGNLYGTTMAGGGSGCNGYGAASKPSSCDASRRDTTKALLSGADSGRRNPPCRISQNSSPDTA